MILRLSVFDLLQIFWFFGLSFSDFTKISSFKTLSYFYFLSSKQVIKIFHNFKISREKKLTAGKNQGTAKNFHHFRYDFRKGSF